MKDGNAARTAPYATECDLVMKGGITSGIVYPLAITEIARAFRLRSIGGTSAGAIAAAAAAAAETGRQRFASGMLVADPDGFGQLAGLPALLGRPDASGRGTTLLAFFKPAARLRPVFNAVVRALGVRGAARRGGSIVVSLLASHWLVAVAAFAMGTLPLWGLALDRRSAAAWLWTVVFAAGLAVGAVVWRVARTVLALLPRHGFGICSGMPEPGDPAPQEALTVWLSRYLDALSGQAAVDPGTARPLTFGDLRRQGVELQVMTTCLTMGRPFRLPFRDDDDVRENNVFFWDEREFAALFPAHVVDWMKTHERPVSRAPEARARFADVDFTGLRRLPLPDDLPVVVAVRMSLSFPVLLSAVPLRSIDFRKPRRPGERPEVCWFTDGGVGSNFPIHFFDAPVPTRPTFGLDLGSLDPGDDPDSPRVVFPDSNGDARLVYWKRFADGDGLAAMAGFLGTIVNVAKDWNHEALSHLPGFRDRIGLIRLTEEEGGLNLTMPPALIERLTTYGRDAGRQFVRRFGNPVHWQPGMSPSPVDWQNHQLIRLRLMLASVGEMVTALNRSVVALSGGDQDYHRFFVDACGPTTYRFSGLGQLASDPATGLHTTQAGLAGWMLDDLTAMATRVAATIDAHPADRIDPRAGTPRPLPELKLRPRI